MSLHVKRFVDVAVAALLLLALSPVFAIIAGLIRLDEPGPVFHRGLRAGRNGRPFAVFKFRSMTLAPMPRQEITVSNDPRVTRIGRFLRATKLDELPQLFNVLRGEMSLVGPRPESPHYVAYYTAEQQQVLSVRPGITGAAQIYFPHEEELLNGPNPEQLYIRRVMPAKLAIDLDYVRYWSLWLDLKLIVLTLVAIVRPVAPSPLRAQPTSPLRAQPAPAAQHHHLEGRNGGTMSLNNTKGFSSPPEEPSSPEQLQGTARLRAWFAYHIIRRIREYGIVVILDIILVTAAFELATLLRFVNTPYLTDQLRIQFPANLLAGLIYAIFAYLFGLQRRLWRYASIKDGLALLPPLGIMMVAIAALDLIHTPNGRLYPISIAIGGGLFAFLLLGTARVVPRIIYTSQVVPPAGQSTRVLIIGAGQAGAALASRFLVNNRQGYRLINFLDDDTSKWYRRIHGVRILGPVESLPEIVEKQQIDLIAIALPAAGVERIGQILALCQQTSASVKILQGLDQMLGGQSEASFLRPVDVADLLGREVVPLQSDEAHRMLRDKLILVTGAAGSIGSELCRQLLGYAPAMVMALDTNETGLFDFAESLHAHPHADRLRLRIGDVTDTASMDHLFATERPHFVFHAAAYKHVPLLEDHPDQALRTNVLGTYHLARLARKHGVGCFVFISSDKAAAPVNVLGASKRLGELVVQALAREEAGSTRFCGVRFGNVIGSRGSVVPTFLKQIEHKGPVTITDEAVTRYFMTIPEACGLVILASTMADSGGMFLLDMGEPVRIVDLAEKMIRLQGLRVGVDIPIVYTGLRPGERLHEVLSAPDEELLPTSYHKILQIGSDGKTPALSTLEAWMEELEQCWQQEGDKALLQTRLKELTRANPLISPVETRQSVDAATRGSVS
ncbi:MAG TPA: SDR family NAD(P)-dependent oxidoreductase [Ktedonobacterales bacterium]|nr:SDR family NAD(P)-dependent oxidoreductase [Ktedonobacterales bacterium]